MRALALLKGASSLPPLELDRHWAENDDPQSTYDRNLLEYYALRDQSHSVYARSRTLTDGRGYPLVGQQMDGAVDTHPMGYMNTMGGRNECPRWSYSSAFPQYNFGLDGTDRNVNRSQWNRATSNISRGDRRHFTSQALCFRKTHEMPPHNAAIDTLPNSEDYNSAIDLGMDKFASKKQASIDNEWPLPPLTLPELVLSNNPEETAVCQDRGGRRLSDWSDNSEVRTCHATLKKLQQLWGDVQFDEANGGEDEKKGKSSLIHSMSTPLKRPQAAAKFPWYGDFSLEGPASTRSDKAFGRAASAGVNFPLKSPVIDREKYRSRHPHYSLCSTNATGGGSVYSGGGDMELDVADEVKPYQDCNAAGGEGLRLQPLETVESNDRRSSISSSDGSIPTERLLSLMADTQKLQWFDDDDDDDDEFLKLDGIKSTDTGLSPTDDDDTSAVRGGTTVCG